MSKNNSFNQTRTENQTIAGATRQTVKLTTQQNAGPKTDKTNKTSAERTDGQALRTPDITETC